MYTEGFRCFHCNAEYPASYTEYTCTACGGNLDVQYDYDRIRKELDHESIFTSERTDIFRYLPVLPIRDVTLAPPLRIGRTPLYHADKLGALIGLNNVYLKDEGLNPSGSFKDRASALAITKARELGAEVVAGASTGNAGSSMACMAASVGMPAVVFVPAAAPPAKIAQLMIFGANVIAVNGTYDQAFDLCKQVCDEKGWFNRNTGQNPYTREGKKTCSFEIASAFDWSAPDRVIVPTGDGNIISGIWKGFKDLKAIGLLDHLPKIDCAQAEGSAAVSKAVWALREKSVSREDIDWSEVKVDPVSANTVADSISVDDPRDGLAAVRAVVESGGEAVTISDKLILNAICEVARSAGVFCEPSCAVTWAALKQLHEYGIVEKDETVVCLMTGSGLKDVASAKKAAGEPTVIEPTFAAAMDQLSKMYF